jgi:hypothetical protein
MKIEPVVAVGKTAAATAAYNPPAWVVNRNNSEYAVVANRRLFGSDEKHPAPNIGALPQIDVLPAPVSDLTMRQARVDAGTVPREAPTPQTQGIVVVGRVTMDGVEQAVVEDLRRGETRFVPVHGEAFGYRVDELAGDGATLERDGRRFTVTYGEGKQERRTAGSNSNNSRNRVSDPSGATPSFPLVAGATDASSPRNWDWVNMTDDQKRAGENYVRGRAEAMNGAQRDKLVNEWEALGGER